MTYPDLTDKQLIHICKLRLSNEKFYDRVTKIKIENKRYNPIYNEYSFSFIVSSKQSADFRQAIVFTRFFPNEFLYMQKIGIDFTAKIETITN